MGSSFLEDELETDHVCSHCGDDLCLLEEVLLLQVVTPNRTEEGDFFFVVENDTGEDFAFEPQFFHLECWEEISADLDGLSVDCEPFFDDQRLWECDSCSSNIGRWETAGLLSVGELRFSNREPNGDSTAYFHECNTKPRIYCTHCIRTVNDELFEMWENFSHNGECAAGTRQRCWRFGVCRAGCVEQNWETE